MAGAPEPQAPGAMAPDTAPGDDGDKSWISSLFNSSDRAVDSVIVGFMGSVAAYWFLCGYEIVVLKQDVSPLLLGGGIGLVAAAFMGGKTMRDRWSQGAPPG